ncbi:uncharacterized protein LOC130710779 [Lotus japonicus]|uniref:uncharacterized protein LOC130710779 n=1 Tax=Lotus japonicus TaxID=34305 RepID=UPI00258DBB1D|nr:uncharacterized protein LOC130710779 [Lotus japonicus]
MAYSRRPAKFTRPEYMETKFTRPGSMEIKIITQVQVEAFKAAAARVFANEQSLENKSFASAACDFANETKIPENTSSEVKTIVGAGGAKGKKKKKAVMESSSITNGIMLLADAAMKIQKDEEEKN